MKTYKFKELAIEQFRKQVPESLFIESKPYWELLSDDEIKQLSKSKYATIGAHGHLHNNLDQIDQSDSLAELKKNKEYLDAITGLDIDQIAFPDGGYDKSVKEIAAQIGLKWQFAVDYRLETDSRDTRILDRVGVYSYQSCHHQIHTVIRHAQSQ